MAIDYKKTEKNLYQPGTTPAFIDVPEQLLLRVDGKGDPNDPDGEYKTAVELLYALSYTIKMMPKNGLTPEGFFEYVVLPLEGYWWLERDVAGDFTEGDFTDKKKYHWSSVIRQPEFVTKEIFEQAKAIVARKKPDLPIGKAQLVRSREGLCVQCMHIGPYAEEPATVARMVEFTEDNGIAEDFSSTRRHHEIYLSNPLTTEPSKMKTILRHPVRKS